MVLGTMVAEVGRDVGVKAGGLAQERIPRSPAYRDRSDLPLRVARDPYAMAGSRQRDGDMLGELLKGDRVGKLAYPPGAHARRVALLPNERSLHHQTEGRSECVGHPGIGMVGVRMGREQGDAVGDKPMDETALGIGGRHGMNPAQEQRMVRHDELGSGLNRLVDHRHHRIDREQHTFDRVVRVTARQTDRIPVGRETGRVRGVEGHHEITNAQVSHALEGTRRRRLHAVQEVSDSVAAATSASATPINWTALRRSLSRTQARVTVATG